VEAETLIPPTFDSRTTTACWNSDNQSMALSDLRTGTPNLWLVSVFHHVPDKQVTHFNSGTLWSCAYSADGKWLAFGRGNSQRDVVLFTAGK
jgi:hypothetical protein